MANTLDRDEAGLGWAGLVGGGGTRARACAGQAHGAGDGADGAEGHRENRAGQGGAAAGDYERAGAHRTPALCRSCCLCGSRPRRCSPSPPQSPLPSPRLLLSQPLSSSSSSPATVAATRCRRGGAQQQSNQRVVLVFAQLLQGLSQRAKRTVLGFLSVSSCTAFVGVCFY